MKNIHPMKILITHNDYGRPSGEEAAVDHMTEMMTAHGHQISLYRPSTAAYQQGFSNKIHMFFSGLYSWQGIKDIRKTLKEETPDIINIHNLYPFISPAALFACKAAGIPIVMTVHNYRLVCPTGLLLRNGQPCEHCLHERSEWGCFRYNCTRNLFKSFGYSLREYVARTTGAYQKNVDRYVCLTDFQKYKLIAAGFPADKITVIPNSVPIPGTEPAQTGRYIAFIGRMSYEKGWDMLVNIAAANPDLLIRAAGFLPVPSIQASMPPNIQFTGFLDPSERSEFYRAARFIVMPSRCYEGLPLVALEAMAMGRPVIAPDHGGFTGIIGKGPEAIGCLFRPNDQVDLETNIRKLWTDDKLVKDLGKRAIEKAATAYSSEIIYHQWERLFREVLQTEKN